jgi:hypothetical protein
VRRLEGKKMRGQKLEKRIEERTKEENEKVRSLEGEKITF